MFDLICKLGQPTLVQGSELANLALAPPATLVTDKERRTRASNFEGLQALEVVINPQRCQSQCVFNGVPPTVPEHHRAAPTCMKKVIAMRHRLSTYY
jgi:hypothetical protein